MSEPNAKAVELSFGLRKSGIPLSIRPDPEDIIRFLKLVDKNKLNGCWYWKGYKDHKGYGEFKHKGKKHWAHRWARQVFRGQFKMGETAEHVCRNAWCVNPDHLIPLDRETNSKLSNEVRGEKRRRIPVGPDGLPIPPDDVAPF